MASAQVRFVDDDASPGGSGLSWATAYRHLQHAIDEAAGDMGIVEIRVAQGLYKPGQTTGTRIDFSNPSATFEMRSGLAIRGGYRGIGSAGDPDERNYLEFETILSGDIGTTGLASDNCYHVVTSSATDPTAILDGFTITGGNATDSPPNDSGGGLFNGGGNPTVINCRFLGNSAGTGGGMANGWYCNPIVTNCTFVGNCAEYGAGMYNALFSMPTLANCTFTANVAVGFGGGMYNYQNTSILDNCILWGNIDCQGTGEWSQIYDDFGMTDARYCCIQDDDPDDGYIPYGGAANGNIDDNPVFNAVPDSGLDGKWNSADDDYGDLYLHDDSPCIDAGNNMSVPLDAADVDGDEDETERTPLDVRHNPRFMDHPETPDTGVADPPDYEAIVDMGAYEHQVTPIVGDLDGDRDVDLDDFHLLESCFTGPRFTAADRDGDWDVDLDDFALWYPCLTGPNVAAGTGCGGTDFTGDDDVDLADIARFQREFTGPQELPSSTCLAADLEADQDVDLGDFAAFAAAFAGDD